MIDFLYKVNKNKPEKISHLFWNLFGEMKIERIYDDLHSNFLIDFDDFEYDRTSYMLLGKDHKQKTVMNMQ